MTRRAFGNALRETRELLAKFHPTRLVMKRGSLDQAYLSRLEHGLVDPKFSMIHRLAIALNVDINAFWTEILHHMAKLGIIEAHPVRYCMEILPDGVLSVSAASRIDAVSNRAFIEQIFGVAKQANCRKILLDLSLCLCHFSKEEHHAGSKHGLNWMRKNSFWPTVAVVANSTLDHFGASVAQQEGQCVQIFSRKPEAHHWLKQQTIKKV